MLPPSITKTIGTLLDQAERILVITHLVPDGDALGSLTATGQALQQLNKSFSLVVDDGLPSRFSYLPLAQHVLVAPDADLDHARSKDAVEAIAACQTAGKLLRFVQVQLQVNNS